VTTVTQLAFTGNIFSPNVVKSQVYSNNVLC